MINLPPNVDINNLIGDLRDFSWEASEILLNYSQILKDSKNKSNILKNDNEEDPVTLADLKVNELIIRRIKENYKTINWEILSEENAKLEEYQCDLNSDFVGGSSPLRYSFPLRSRHSTVTQ